MHRTQNRRGETHQALSLTEPHSIPAAALCLGPYHDLAGSWERWGHWPAGGGLKGPCCELQLNSVLPTPIPRCAKASLCQLLWYTYDKKFLSDIWPLHVRNK